MKQPQDATPGSGELPPRELGSVDREIVAMLIETRAVNFEALGHAIATLGPKSVTMADDGWIRFCGSDLRIFRWPRRGLELEDIAALGDLVRGLPGRH